MVFSTQFFVYFFLALLFPCYYLARSTTARKVVLVAFSLFFYAWGEPIFVGLMITMIAANYLSGILVASSRTQRSARVWLIISIVFDLAVLCAFKYSGLFVRTFNSIFSFSIPEPSIRMPVGISFFTFQAMSYVIDVYRGDVRPQGRFLNLLLYVSLFPQLIAGPIVRYKDIENQLDDRRVHLYDINDGFFRFSIGLAKKIIIADRCFEALNILQSNDNVTFAGSWLIALLFTLQIYFDFSGYSDMAIGLGRMFGFKFNENFRHPYASSSATEFWRRWHISLGTFFRDYVYIPLGGKRRYQIRNIIIVWLLTGFWHGDSWNYVLWGVYYAALLILEKKVLLNFFERLPKAASFLVSKLYFIFITLFGFSIFYYRDFSKLFPALGNMFGFGVSSFSSNWVHSVFMQNCILIPVAIFLSLPLLSRFFSFIGRLISPTRIYAVYRYSRLIAAIVLIFISTFRMAGMTFSPFLYWAF